VVLIFSVRFVWNVTAVCEKNKATKWLQICILQFKTMYEYMKNLCWVAEMEKRVRDRTRKRER
jgi:hypothetical protein